MMQKSLSHVLSPSHLDNALDIAEMHKGQGAILEKVSVVTKPKAKLGKKI